MNNLTLRQQTKQLDLVIQKQQRCNEFIVKCNMELEELVQAHKGRSGRYNNNYTERKRCIDNMIVLAKKGILPGDPVMVQDNSDMDNSDMVHKYKENLATPISPKRGRMKTSKSSTSSSPTSSTSSSSPTSSTPSSSPTSSTSTFKLPPGAEAFAAAIISIKKQEKLIYYPPLRKKYYGALPIIKFDPTFFKIEVKCIKCKSEVKKNGRGDPKALKLVYGFK